MAQASPKLGRGLAALFGEIPTETPAGESGVAVQALEPNPYQPRKSIPEAALHELAASIERQGVLQPLLIRPLPGQSGRYQIIAGERRWRAAMLAGLTEVPCLVRALTDAEASAAALVENLQREDLNPIEEAEGLKRLGTDFGMTQEDLGRTIGKSRSYIANQLRLLSLPEPVLELLRTGTLTAGHGRAALATADPAAAAAQMVSQHLSVRQAEALATSARPPEQRPPRATAIASADLRAVERDLMDHLGMSVSIRARGQGGELTLRYATLDQLDHLIARLGRR